MLILDLWGVSFHAAVFFGLGKDFLFKSTLGHCVLKGSVVYEPWKWLMKDDQNE